MCDIENFKAYNDTYGHKRGDECLQLVAKVIEETLNRPADFCARYGGGKNLLLFCRILRLMVQVILRKK